jgi:cellulose biosynthesis protein BcsQ
MAVCVSLINMKGGVGKTTLATQIAWYATRKMDKRNIWGQVFFVAI